MSQVACHRSQTALRHAACATLTLFGHKSQVTGRKWHCALRHAACDKLQSILSKKRAKIKLPIQKRKQILSNRLTFISRYVNIS
jgi:hypothetical protein